MTDLLIVPSLTGVIIFLIRRVETFWGFDFSLLSAFEAAVIVKSSYNFDFYRRLNVLLKNINIII